MFNLKINVKFLFLVVIVLLVGVLGFVGWQKLNAESPYYAVFLQTGDLYFGQLSRSFIPSSRVDLKNVYILARTNDEKNPFSLQKFSDAFWGPSGQISLSRDKVVWINKLKSDSQVAGAIKAAGSGAQQFAPQAAVPQQLPQAPETPAQLSK
ncbi:MAG: hypothetical protein HYW34_01115 [Candidatus Brennerbacteria bacterium]|nr:hypothetical protein [Candidatus Brennerbacteria bacterium]